MTITLKTLHSASLQEIFDQCAVHMLEQGERAVDSNGSCRYLDRDTGLKCAVGCLINKDEYSTEMETNNAASILSDHFLYEEHPSHEKLSRILNNLQWIHDDWPPHKWYELLCRSASDWELNTDKIKKYEGLIKE